jgi:uncharacterized protein YjbJ (UPF0337 family)
MSGRDEKMEGKWDETKGKAKEGWGNLTGDERTRAEGRDDQAEGKAKQAWGGVKDAAGDAKDAVKDTFDRDKP